MSLESSSFDPAAQSAPESSGEILTAEEPVASIALLEGGSPVSHYRLERDVRLRIGREVTNHVRLTDGACSRVHCEVFQTAGHWVLRDNLSRNGTFIGRTRIRRDVKLKDGTVFTIGQTQLQFNIASPDRRPAEDLNRDTNVQMNSLRDTRPGGETIELAARRPESSSAILRSRPDSGEGDPGQNTASDDDVLRQAKRSKYSDPELDTAGDPETAAVFAKLYKLAARIAAAPTVRDLSETAIDGLLEHTAATFGGVLMLPSTKSVDRDPGKLEIKAVRVVDDLPYSRMSQRISYLAFERDVGIHFRAASESDDLQQSDSVRELSVSSAACVPVKLSGRVAGLIHLYTQDAGRPVTDDDFEFALALAERFSEALGLLVERNQIGLKLKRAEATADALRERVKGQSAIVGDSDAVKELRRQIERVAPSDATALIRGESGVGKELVAEAMHYSSGRSGGPFVCMNCAALSESLLESELFGHEKGAFTGATGKKLGKFEQADGGTLLLDEVGEMTMAIQSKFLRVLEGHPFERVGGSTPITTDVRVVAATNRDLEDAVREGSFRRDLYFRLQVMQIDIPPLRDRRADISLLAQHFVERFRRKSGRDVRGLSPAANSKLVSYHWPGNIRELLNTIERAVILAEGELIEPEEIFLSTLDESTPPLPLATDGDFLELSIEDVERDHILRTLEATDWNKTKAAQVLGIERSTLDRKLKKYGVRRPN